MAALPIGDYLKKHGVDVSKKRGALWKGPEVDGITFSLLSRFIQCRERFRCYVVEGLRPAKSFNHRIEYGQMWHVCEEAHAKSTKPIGGADSWKVKLRNYCLELMKQYPAQRKEVNHWHNVCLMQFPAYVEYWSKHKDVLARKPLLQEQVFSVPYHLPTGRTVILRGKWDSVDLVYSKKDTRNNGIWVQENKTKGDVREEQLKRQLKFDLQTMMYVVAIEAKQSDGSLSKFISPDGLTSKLPIKGVRYNVIRRPLSGGKGTIKQKKATKNHPAETAEEYYGRLSEYIENEPETYFMRFNVEVSQADIENFKTRCLNPLLEQLCDWWEWIKADPFDPYASASNNHNCLHWQHPFGVRNMLDEGGSTDLDDYVQTGNKVGLTRVDNLFSELV